jgi:hypothetical protein
MKTRKVFFKIQKANLIGCTGSSEFWKVIWASEVPKNALQKIRQFLREDKRWWIKFHHIKDGVSDDASSLSQYQQWMGLFHFSSFITTLQCSHIKSLPDEKTLCLNHISRLALIWIQAILKFLHTESLTFLCSHTYEQVLYENFAFKNCQTSQQGNLMKASHLLPQCLLSQYCKARSWFYWQSAYLKSFWQIHGVR